MNASPLAMFFNSSGITYMVVENALILPLLQVSIELPLSSCLPQTVIADPFHTLPQHRWAVRETIISHVNKTFHH